MGTEVNEDTCCDISMDAATQLIEEGVAAHQAIMLEAKGDWASAASLTRHAGARKFNQEDPIEAAAAEKILKA